MSEKALKIGGEQVGWFDSREIWIETIVSVAGSY